MFPRSKKTVASVMAAFTRTLSELESVETTQRVEAQRQAELAAEANAAHEAALKEADLARETIETFKAMIPKIDDRGFGTFDLREVQVAA